MKMFDINSFKPFLEWLERWYRELKVLKSDEVFAEPQRVAIASVDLVVGFCYEGPLSSPRVAAIVPEVTELFKLAYSKGVRDFLIFQDSHSSDAQEFGSFAPHCVAGSPEAQMIPELSALDFARDYRVFEKNSISSSIGTGLDDWLKDNERVDTFIVVGDCTDLCVYQLAMHLKLSANAGNISRRIIVPASCVATYDLPVEVAEGLNAYPHDGDLLHRVFLYHMALNGMDIVSAIVE